MKAIENGDFTERPFVQNFPHDFSVIFTGHAALSFERAVGLDRDFGAEVAEVRHLILQAKENNSASVAGK